MRRNESIIQAVIYHNRESKKNECQYSDGKIAKYKIAKSQIVNIQNS
jgi:hypothetical protein